METRAERNVIPEPHDASPGTFHLSHTGWVHTTPHHTTPRVLGLYLGGCAELRADSARDISRARCSASSSL